MKSQQPENNVLDKVMEESSSVESQINVLFDIAKNVLDDGAIRSRTVKYKLQKYVKSNDIYKKAYALSKIVNDGKGINTVPNEENMESVMSDIETVLSNEIAKKFVQSKIEQKVEQDLVEKQEKYVDEIRLDIIRKQKGPENSRTLKKYSDFKELDKKKLTKNIQSILRPDSFEEIVGQERAIKSLLSKISSPYPQHIILYGPPGVGKTTAARLALEEAKKLKFTPYDEDSKFVEVDGTTLRWDPREITNPLLGSVHDPIYQGSKRDLANTGIPEPKPGLVTEAHGGILFIDEIGELDSILQNKLLKVLEDKRVEFSSSYYDPEDESTPKYIKYLFDNGAPADFVLIAATTKEPGDINPALRSRCVEVYFEPLSVKDIEAIVENGAKKLNASIEDGVSELISRYTIEGRRAINILSDAYGYALRNGDYDLESVVISKRDVEEVLSIGRLTPYEILDRNNDKEIGHVYGLGVSGFIGSTIEIEATVFPAKKNGSGTVRFNETAGSMAKDSVFNAASVIRKITDIDIKDFDIHVNAIGGGKIDGPSAGAAITICIMSALLNKPIRQDVAITGEISLRGKVKPVGGIFEKVYGAKRKGIDLVIIPRDNTNDIPQDLQDIKIKIVDSIEEIMDIMF